MPKNRWYNPGEHVYSFSKQKIGIVCGFNHRPPNQPIYDVMFTDLAAIPVDGTWIAEVLPRYVHVQLPEDDICAVSESAERAILEGKASNTVACDHQWQPYQGLIESYQFCTKCNKKEN